MNTYFTIQSYRAGQWVTLQFDDYANGIGYRDESYARAWLSEYHNRKWRIVKRVVEEEVLP